MSVADARKRLSRTTKKLDKSSSTVFMARLRILYKASSIPYTLTWVYSPHTPIDPTLIPAYLGWFSNTIGYGLTYGFTDILTPLETSYTLVAALIAGDTPRQITWHLDGARRGGATLEEVQAVRRISMEVAREAGVQWREGVPEVKDEGMISDRR